MPNWLTNFVLPKIRAAVGRKEVPDNLWKQCPVCEQTLFQRDLAADLMVCRHCGHHFRIGSAERFRMLFDAAAFDKIEPPRKAKSNAATIAATPPIRPTATATASLPAPSAACPSRSRSV